MRNLNSISHTKGKAPHHYTLYLTTYKKLDHFIVYTRGANARWYARGRVTVTENDSQGNQTITHFRRTAGSGESDNVYGTNLPYATTDIETVKFVPPNKSSLGYKNRKYWRPNKFTYTLPKLS